MQSNMTILWSSPATEPGSLRFDEESANTKLLYLQIQYCNQLCCVTMGCTHIW